MKIKNVVLFFAFLLLLSCSQQNHFRQFDTLPEDHRWQASDKKSYAFEITDDKQPYTIEFQFSHVYDYQFDLVPINFIIENPAGEKENITIALKIKDSSGKQLAECAGDVCDLYYKIKEKTKLQKGKYKITIFHSFKGPFLPNVIGIGLSVAPKK